jgi:uncharacterized protein (TIGR00251 family)
MKEIIVTAKPNASQNKVEKIDETHFKVWLTASPVDGKANNLLIKLLAEYFKISKSQLAVKRGKTAKTKLLIISG